MASVNKVILVGNLGRDPEVRRLSNGDPVVSFSVATTESWKDKSSGERRDRTEWHNVVVFNEGLCKVAEGYLRKGSKVCVEGQLQTREYTDKEGVKKYATDIVADTVQFLGGAAGGGDSDGGGGYGGGGGNRGGGGGGYGGGGGNRGGGGGGGRTNSPSEDDAPARDQGGGGGNFNDDDIPF